VPIKPNLPNYHVLFPDSLDYVEIPLNQLSALDEPVFTLVDADTAKTTNDTLPSLPDWIKDGTQCSITHDGARQRGKLQSTDAGWQFLQRTARG
jgi:hypothetical protein